MSDRFTYYVYFTKWSHIVGKVKNSIACGGKNIHNEIFVLFTKKTWA